MDLPKLITGREMATVDQRTIAEAGISSTELIERAGAEVVAAIAARWDGLAGLRAVVLCGKGNNGGDGFAAARLLSVGGGSAHVFLAADCAVVQGAAAEHLRRCEQAGCAVEVLGADLAPLDAALREADLVIDALLGTGLRGAPRPALAYVIERMAQCARPVVARDFAGEFGATLVLKGAPTVVALADGRVAVNSTGNAGMATAGSGDVLTGIIAGLMAQGLGAGEAACLGVYVHGRAGDRAAERLGEWGMRAGDIADETALALMDAARSA